MTGAAGTIVAVHDSALRGVVDGEPHRHRGSPAGQLRAGNRSPAIPPSTARDVPVVAPDAGDAR